MELGAQILKGHIDTLLLSLLSERDLYGYELIKTVREKAEGKFDLKEGTMYLSLKRLEENGFIESYWGGTEGGGARRKYYRILESGLKMYSYKKREWSYLKSVLDKFFEKG